MTEETKETKAQAFRRVANPRLRKALDALDVLKKCANPHTYDYTNEQIRTMETVLHDRVNSVIAAFDGEPEDTEDTIL